MTFLEMQQVVTTGQVAAGLSEPRHSATAGSYLPQSVSSVRVEKPSLKPSCWW